MIKIGYLGPEGTFSEKAARMWLQCVSTPHRLEAKENLPQLFRDLENGQLAQIIVPVENSIEGAVTVTQDYLISLPGIKVLGEISLAVEHYLVAKTLLPLADITAVYSHPQALAQCHRFLERHLGKAKLVQTTSTAEAARLVSEAAEPIAAVTSADAAAKYHLAVLAERIQDFHGNKTRFWAVGLPETCTINISKEHCDFKTSIVVALPYNRPGGLHMILTEFAAASLDLTRIESRPTKKELGEYLFIIDFLGHVHEETVAKTFNKLQSKDVMIKVLGSFPVLT
ncbi:MAG TPA: prephenate dehydratase [Clostridia bacterium]|nr:prephenate dehydratase [Clostridia bacterium]